MILKSCVVLIFRRGLGMVIDSALNIIFDPVFILWLDMGIIDAVIAANQIQVKRSNDTE